MKAKKTTGAASPDLKDAFYKPLKKAGVEIPREVSDFVADQLSEEVDAALRKRGVLSDDNQPTHSYPAKRLQ